MDSFDLRGFLRFTQISMIYLDLHRLTKIFGIFEQDLIFMKCVISLRHIVKGLVDPTLNPQEQGS